MRARRSFVAVTALSLVTGLALAGCASSEGDSGPSPAGSSTSPSGVESPTPDTSTVAPVYYLVDTGVRAGLRLAREPRDLAGATPEDVARSAVETMIAGPEDPDYATTWNPETEVLGVSKPRRVVKVNLSEDARQANVGSPGAALMIQQLVYTVTEVLGPAAPVRLLIEGEPAGELWGAVSWDKPVRRADPTDVRLLVQIDLPREGASASSPLTVTGDANAFEANVPWRVLNTKGKVVRRGYTLTSEGMTFAPFSFTVKLPPGTFTVEVREDDPSGGEAPGRPMRDTRTVVVQ